MKILMVQNRYLIRGGEDECFDSESNLLESYGHQIIKYVRDNQQIEQIPSWRVGLRTVWSQEDYQKIRYLLQEKKPDIVHVQNFFPLISPAVYYAAKAEKIPVIQTLQNYRLWCVNGYFLRNESPCEDCMGKFIPFPGVINSCYRNSPAASLAVATMLTAHRAIQTWTKMVDSYIAVTEFAREKFIEGGIPAAKIAIKPNFIPTPELGDGDGNFMLFVGRLSEEKGLRVLLEAWNTLGNVIPLKIVGDGPLKSYIQESVSNTLGVEYLDRQPLNVVYELMGKAKALIFPSLWYEGLPRTIIESFAKGTPVIGSNLGAMSTLIEHQRTGLHFTPGNSDELIKQVKWMTDRPAELGRMRKEARAEFESKYTAQSNYQTLIDIYRLAIENSRTGKS